MLISFLSKINMVTNLKYSDKFYKEKQAWSIVIQNWNISCEYQHNARLSQSRSWSNIISCFLRFLKVDMQ